MSSETGSDTPPSVLDANAVHSGRCKWFNNKAGYGFLTVVRSTDDTMVGKDVFAHHTGITVNNEQYRYLVQGEYVDFSLVLQGFGGPGRTARPPTAERAGAAEGVGGGINPSPEDLD